MNSNITILSNVYIRENIDIKLDTAFVARVRGQSALRKLKNEYNEVVLTEWQENMRQKDMSCSRALNGEVTHGLIRREGVLVWEGRCEYKNCERFSDCKETAKFQRVLEPQNECEKTYTEALEYVWLKKAAKEVKKEDTLFDNSFVHIKNIGRLDICQFEENAGKALILCKTGGEAEYASHVLFRRRIPHTLLRDEEVDFSLIRHIADCLWDYHGGTSISRDDFTNRYTKRVKDDEHTANVVYDALLDVSFDEHNTSLDLNKLAENLNKEKAKLPDVLLNKKYNQLTVSTIQNAWGLEFDLVYILDSDENHDEDCWYKAYAQMDLNIFKISQKKDLYVKRSETNSSRYVQLQRKKWLRPPKYFCLNLAVGLKSDFSKTGFIQGSFFDALKLQEYISQNIKIGDSVEIKYVDNEYKVFHKKCIIGNMPAEITSEFFQIANEINEKSSIPPSLSKVYVSNIITIAAPKKPEGVQDFFQNAKFWLGVELTGFPKIDWKVAPEDYQ